jgi:serine/threonine protein phosphatase PrpC
MKQPTIVAGSCINRGQPGCLGFDAFVGDPGRGMFVMCDGANSCPDSGQAAQWLAEALAFDPRVGESTLGFDASIRALHHDMLIRFPQTAATVLALRVDPQGLTLATVGDSRMTLLTPSWWGWGPWRTAWHMPQDINAEGHPSQLVGSEVLDQVHLRHVKAQGRCLVALMTDGAAHVIDDRHLCELVQPLGRQMPSADDLNYWCETMASQALARGCQDDISVALVMVRFD